MRWRGFGNFSLYLHPPRRWSALRLLRPGPDHGLSLTLKWALNFGPVELLRWLNGDEKKKALAAYKEYAHGNR